MRFTLKDTNYFLLPGNSHMLHLATVGMGLREFVVMMDRRTHQMYIEEVVLESTDLQSDVWANFKFIDDDALAEDLAGFCQDNNVRDIKRIAEVLTDRGVDQWLTRERS